jgi:pimeloyl-ACP methyl ester carboxylesterase
VINSAASSAACRGADPGTPCVVLIHGVGFGPATLAPLADALAPYTRVEIPARRGYGERALESPAPTVEEHVNDLFDALDAAGLERAVLAGISGGATIALAAGLARPERVVTAVAHEPAVGSVSPELRSLIVAALSDGGGCGLARFLAGEETWAALPPPLLGWLADNTALIEADAAAFARYEPAFPVAGAVVPLVCSLGGRSSPARAQVAEQLAARTGAPIVSVRDCGHLPQFDAPDAFVEVIVTHALSTDPGRSAPGPRPDSRQTQPERIPK